MEETAPEVDAQPELEPQAEGGIEPDSLEDSGAVGEPAEKRVTWAELFFDLVFVVAVTELSALVERDHSWAGLLRALIVFVPIYWVWVGTAIQTNLQDAGRPVLRLRIFVIALAAIFMALSLGGAYTDLGLVFALAYWLGRIVLATPVLRNLSRFAGFPINPYTVSVFVTGPLLVVGALVHGDAREAVWGLAALIDLSGPTLLQSRMLRMHFDAAHLAERFGLFVLIALGESVVSVGTSTPLGELTVSGGFAVAAAFALSCGLWWVYFHYAADAMRHSLATARVQLDISRLVLSYGHLSFIAAIVAVAVGLHESIAHPVEHLSWAVTGLLFGGTALYLATFGFTRWAMFRLVSTTRLSTAAVVAALAPVAPHVPALVSLITLAAVLAALNLVELMRVEHTGWRARRGHTVR
jgi:low temperature requirement protein LtrA